MHLEEKNVTDQIKKINVPWVLSSDFSIKSKTAELLDFCSAPSGFNVKLDKKRKTGGLDSPLRCKPGLLASFGCRTIRKVESLHLEDAKAIIDRSGREMNRKVN